jgi:putative addiction module component (TIGR02574 family)
MSLSVDEIASEVEKLPLAKREELLHRLTVLTDADPAASQDEIDAAWEQELKRRIDEVDSGKVKMIPADEVFAELEARRRDPEN